MSVKISDLLPEAVSIPVGRGSLSIRPLDLQSVTQLIQEYRAPILELIDSARSGDPDYMALVAQSPDLAATIIALAADAVGQEDDIKKLPATSQVQALLAIWEVSVPDPKGFMDSLTVVFQNLKAESTNLATLKSLSNPEVAQP